MLSLRLIASGILSIALVIPCSAIAEPALDANSQKALQDTQQLLTNPSLRTQSIRKDPAAAKVDAQVEQVTGGGANKEEAYQISSDIMNEIVKKTGGDPVKMVEMLERAKTNPEAFFKSLSPEQQEKIRRLSTRMPAAQGSSGATQPGVPK
jgi:hypothetical protein